MRRTLSSLVIMIMSSSAVLAGNMSTPPITLVQGSITIGPGGVVINPNNRDRDRDRERERFERDRDRDRMDRDRDRDRPRRPPPDRFVCVVPPPQSSDRRRPYVCDARPGRVGERCRCGGVPGGGRLDIDR